MENFKPCPLSPTGMVLTTEGEIVLASLDNVSLETQGHRRTAYTRGLVTVTTHRFVWTDHARKSCISFPLLLLPRQNPVEQKPFSSRLLLHIGSGIYLECSAASSKEREQLVVELTNAVVRREWERIAENKRLEAEKKAKEGEYVRRRLGASGVADKITQRDHETGYSIATGFASLDQLRGQAEALMQIAQTFKTATARAERGAEENELLIMMAEMGINSPVTKESTGGNVKVYREQLARQMAGFLRQPILNLGGIMTLSDAYCLVMRNRATTELVSPEDFRIACGYFERLGLMIEVVTLEGGVLALSLDAARDDSGAKALRKLAEERNSITPIDVVRIRHVPIQRARSMLEDAERVGFLTRDFTTEGLRFFPNLFDSFADNKVYEINA